MPILSCVQRVGLMTCMSLMLAPSAWADTWPTSTIRLIVPYGTGGTPDTLARGIAERLRTSLGRPVMVDNKPGGGGVIAIENLRNAPADGHTLLVADTGQLAINPALRDDLPYDAIKDFTAVTQISTQDFSIAVNAKSPYKTMSALIDGSRSAPNGLFYGTSGIGSVHHLGSEQLQKLTKSNFTHVPYKGLQFSIPALLGGEVSFLLSSASPLIPHAEAGNVRFLARASATRSPLMPDVPTLKELGVPLVVGVSVGIVVAAGTPAPIVERLSGELRKIIKDPSLAQQFSSQDFSLVGSSAEEYSTLIKNEAVFYKKFVKENGIKVD